MTILLFSIPYFASYFINFNKRLHQIEDAIVLLSDKDLKNTTFEASKSEIEKEPPYSAVVEMEVPSLGDLYSKEVLQQETLEEPELPEADDLPSEDQEQVAQEIELNENLENDKQISEVLEAGEVVEEQPAPRKKTAEEIDREAGQLSLLDSFFVEEPREEDIAEESVPLKQDVVDEPLEEQLPHREPLRTAIQAYVLLDKGNDLYVRGNSTFWKDEGLKMDLIDVGKYELLTEQIEESVDISFWLDDKKASSDGTYRIEPGSNNEFYPEF